MLPPSDSYLHQNLKLAEAISGLQAIEVPPPAYDDQSKPFVNQSAEDYDSDTEFDYDNMLRAPIVVNIDASVHVEGQGNSIAFFNTESLANGTNTGPTAVGRIESITSTVLAALSMHQDTEISHISARPVQVNVNAPITVKGDKNVVYLGGPRPNRKIARKVSEAEEGASTEMGVKRKAQSVSL